MQVTVSVIGCTGIKITEWVGRLPGVKGGI